MSISLAANVKLNLVSPSLVSTMSRQRLTTNSLRTKLLNHNCPVRESEKLATRVTCITKISEQLRVALI